VPSEGISNATLPAAAKQIPLLVISNLQEEIEIRNIVIILLNTGRKYVSYKFLFCYLDEGK
jgi:hypothetical protein